MEDIQLRGFRKRGEIFEHVDFYKRKFGEAGVTPEDIKSTAKILPNCLSN